MFKYVSFLLRKYTYQLFHFCNKIMERGGGVSDKHMHDFQAD